MTTSSLLFSLFCAEPVALFQVTDFDLVWIDFGVDFNLFANCFEPVMLKSSKLNYKLLLVLIRLCYLKMFHVNTSSLIVFKLPSRKALFKL